MPKRLLEAAGVALDQEAGAKRKLKQPLRKRPCCESYRHQTRRNLKSDYTFCGYGIDKDSPMQAACVFLTGQEEEEKENDGPSRSYSRRYTRYRSRTRTKPRKRKLVECEDTIKTSGHTRNNSRNEIVNIPHYQDYDLNDLRGRKTIDVKEERQKLRLKRKQETVKKGGCHGCLGKNKVETILTPCRHCVYCEECARNPETVICTQCREEYDGYVGIEEVSPDTMFDFANAQVFYK